MGVEQAGIFRSGSEAPGTWLDRPPLQLSTFPQARLSTVSQELTCDFARIIHKSMHRQLSWQVRRLLPVSNESREEVVISRDAPPSGGPEVTLMRIAC